MTRSALIKRWDDGVLGAARACDGHFNLRDEDAMSDTTRQPPATDEHDDIMYPSAVPFIVMHLACFAAIFTGVTWQAITICIALYWLRIFAIGAGYHRYFSHRA